VDYYTDCCGQQVRHYARYLSFGARGGPANDLPLTVLVESEWVGSLLVGLKILGMMGPPFVEPD
jgi:hypothetical protein